MSRRAWSFTCCGVFLLPTRAQRVEQAIPGMASFLTGPDVCPQLGNKSCPRSRESHSGDSSVCDTFPHLLIIHGGSLQRAFEEVTCGAWLPKTIIKLQMIAKRGVSTRLTSTAEKAVQLTDKAMKEGKRYPNASTVSPKANDPKPSEHSSLTHVSASTVLGTRTLSELLLCVDPSAGPSLLSLAAQRSLSIMSSKHLFLGFTYSSLPIATADSQVTILLLSSCLHSGHSPAQQT